MRLQFDQQLRQLKAEMLDMGGMCQMAIQQIVESILNGDASRVKNIHEMMNEISQQERSIENICLLSFDSDFHRSISSIRRSNAFLQSFTGLFIWSLISLSSFTSLW